ncbi:hypothetical protein Rsub_12866 [Raphidocelis subcapitata]|uniref:Uncharacterized protein n=1 Tax=Raphidocelis subcapitata TaxID=307507 RepID=A0A2V0PPR2_9CHLO|nr:hypothetical protein Rsub_12866 [Raphidocelis subcapitata]|eukprot:GBG00041.1 hypothetical protein Rsub_12866 [Raphidocelis subcapitata]
MARDTAPRGGDASDAPSKDARSSSSSKAAKLKPSAGQGGEAAHWFSGGGLRRRLSLGSQEPKDAVPSSADRDAAPRRAPRKAAPLPARVAGAAAAMLVVGVPLMMLASGGGRPRASIGGAQPTAVARGGGGGSPPAPGASSLTAAMSACAARTGALPPVALPPAAPPPPLGAPLALEHDPLRALHLDCDSPGSEAACAAVAAGTNAYYDAGATDDLLPVGYLDSWQAYAAAALLTERAALQGASAPSQLDALALDCEADAEACAEASAASNAYGEAGDAAGDAEAYAAGVAEAMAFLGAAAPAEGAAEGDHDPLAALAVDCESDEAAAAACEAARRASNAYGEGEEEEGEWAAVEDAAAAEHDHAARLFEGAAQPASTGAAAGARAGGPAEVYQSWQGDDAALAALEARKRAAAIERQRAAEWLGASGNAAAEAPAAAPAAEAVAPAHPARTYFKNPCNNPRLHASFKNPANDAGAHAGRMHYKHAANDPLVWMASAVEASLGPAAPARGAAADADAAAGLWSKVAAALCTGLAGAVAFAYLQRGSEASGGEETARASSRASEAAAPDSHLAAPDADAPAFDPDSPLTGAPAPNPLLANLKSALPPGLRHGQGGGGACDGGDVDVVPSGAIDSPRRGNTPLFGRSATPLSARRARRGSPDPAGDE